MFAEKIKELRKNKGVTQAELADHLEITQQAVARWEKSITSPDYEMLKKIALFFHVSTDYLLGNENSNTSYYNNLEVASLANELKDNPDMRILFDASKKLSQKDLAAVINIVKSINGDGN